MHYLSTRQRFAIRLTLIGAALATCLAAILIWPKLDHVIQRHGDLMLGAALLLLLASLLAYRFLLRYEPRFPSGFQASVHHRNIALDHASDRLWVRTPDAHEYMLRSEQVRYWKHEWTHAANRLGLQRKSGNRIVLELEQPQGARIGVDFGRDHVAASQWQARIAYWKRRDLRDLEVRRTSF